MRIEILMSTLAFGTSSLFWLIAALRIKASDYGVVMQCQALLVMGFALFSLRTYDLVFHFQQYYAKELRQSFYWSLRLELYLYGVSTICVTVLLFSGIVIDIAKIGNTIIIIVCGFLCGTTVLQGSSQAYLRAVFRDRNIALVDFCSAVCFAILTVWVIFSKRLVAIDLLTGSMIVNAVRPIMLVGTATMIAKAENKLPTSCLVFPPKFEIVKFLVAGQLTNLFKNNLIAIETLLLGRLAGSEAVALFRISRSFLNFPNVPLNISYQKTFRMLIACKRAIDRAEVLKIMTRTSLKLWALSLPIVFIAAATFVKIRAGSVYDHLLPVIGLATLATIATALQQSLFAALTIDGRYGKIAFAYLTGIIILFVGCLLWPGKVSIYVFLIVSVAASLVRYMLLRDNYLTN